MSRNICYNSLVLKLNAKQLRTTKSLDKEKKKLKRNPIYIICDNVIDTYNIGSIFRLADAVAVEKVYLCGVSETPPNTRIKKASINTTEWVNWEYCETTLLAIEKLRSQIKNIQIVAIEQNKKSVSFKKAGYKFPVALIVSNETNGASREVLNASDLIVEMPMFGVNKSLNVVVSLSIVLYQIVG